MHPQLSPGRGLSPQNRRPPDGDSCAPGPHETDSIKLSQNIPNHPHKRGHHSTTHKDRPKHKPTKRRHLPRHSQPPTRLGPATRKRNTESDPTSSVPSNCNLPEPRHNSTRAPHAEHNQPHQHNNRRYVQQGTLPPPSRTKTPRPPPPPNQTQLSLWAVFKTCVCNIPSFNNLNICVLTFYTVIITRALLFLQLDYVCIRVMCMHTLPSPLCLANCVLYCEASISHAKYAISLPKTLPTVILHY